jgi:hypothetical protein
VSDRGPTRAQLQAALDKAEAERVQAIEQANAWRDHKLADDESTVVAGCVKALDKIAPQRSGYGNIGRDSKGDVGRVLRYLADRYGVNLAPPEPVDDRATAMRDLTWTLQGLQSQIGSVLAPGSPSPETKGGASND